MRMELNEFDIKLDGQVEIFYYNSQKYNGIIFENFNGNIASEFEIKNGVKNGIEKVYFENGNTENISEYKNGLLHGLTKNYYENGKLEEEAIFEFGICLSHKLYDENGNINPLDKSGIFMKRISLVPPERNLQRALCHSGSFS